MIYGFDADDTACRICGEGFELGDNMTAIWHGPSIEDDFYDLAFDGEVLNFYHAGCMKVADARPPKLVYAKGPRHDAVIHVLGQTYDGHSPTLEHRTDGHSGTLCGVSASVVGDWDVWKRRKRWQDVAGLCKHCRQSLVRASREGGL